MRISAKNFRRILTLFDDIHIKPAVAPKTPKISVPLAPAPKPSGMGISVERTAAKTKAIPEVVHPIEVPHAQPRPFLTQTAKNPYNILDNPRQQFALTSEEEFIAHLNSSVTREYGEIFPIYSEKDKVKLVELFRQDPQMVQYLESLKTSVANKLECRFSPEGIEKLLKAMKTDEKYVLGLINQTNATGAPELYEHQIMRILKNYTANPETTKFLLSKQVKIEDLEKLIAISKRNPEQYQKMLKSGLFDLIEEGKLPKTIFENIRENLFFTENFLKDVSKVHSGEPLVREIPQGTALKDIDKFVERGEVGVLNGKLYANQLGKAVEINLSKEKFEELFPLMERFKMGQGYLGDCWLVSAMDNLISNTEQRVNLYRLFSQEGSDILIRYPHGKNALRFVNGGVYEDDAFIESGAKGLRMLEQSFIFHRAKAYTKGADSTDVIARLSENPNLMYKLESGVQGEFTGAVEGLDNFSSAKGWKDFFTVEIYRPIKFRLKTLGKKHNSHTKLKRWKDEKSTDIMVYNCEKGVPARGREGLVNYDYDLHAPHAYSVQNYSIANQTVTITNPHHTEVHINAPLDVLEDYGHFTRFNRV